ncbi:hypothetical protein R6Q57_028565 [Mikania cordata]
MADQSSVTLQKKFHHRAKELNIAIGLSKVLIDDRKKMGFSGNQDSLVLKKKDSTRILGSETIGVNQDHKRRCLEKLLVRREPTTQQNVEDVNCALEAEVIDDTALIEATAAVTSFRNLYRKETGLGFGKNPGNYGGSRNPKEENDGKNKRNAAFKKQGKRCSMKCMNEKKSNVQMVEDKSTSEKQISEVKGKKACRKMSANVKCVYQKKDAKNQKLVTGVEEHLKIENKNSLEKIVGRAIQETDVILNVSVENEKESTIKLVETETVNEKDDGLKLNPQIDVLNHNESEDQNGCVNTNAGSKKNAYSREEMEAMRFVDEEGQKNKWTQVYRGFASSVAREYNGLVVDANNRALNCSSARHANAILGVPPVLPLCSPSNYRKFEPYDRVQGKVQLKSPS